MKSREHQQAHYRQFYDNCFHESLYWRYQLRDTFERMAQEIRKPKPKRFWLRWKR